MLGWSSESMSVILILRWIRISIDYVVQNKTNFDAH